MRATLSTARAKRGTMIKRVALAGSITSVLIACACGTWESSARAADASADAAVDDAGAESVDSGAEASAPATLVASQTGDTCAVSRGAGAGKPSSAPVALALVALVSALAARRFRVTASGDDRA